MPVWKTVNAAVMLFNGCTPLIDRQSEGISCIVYDIKRIAMMQVCNVDHFNFVSYSYIDLPNFFEVSGTNLSFRFHPSRSSRTLDPSFTVLLATLFTSNLKSLGNPTILMFVHDIPEFGWIVLRYCLIGNAELSLAFPEYLVSGTSLEIPPIRSSFLRQSAVL